MKKKYVKQDDLKDCGISSLLMIIRYYGGDVPKEYLRNLTKTTKDGVSAFYLLKAAQQLGFSTKALKGDIKELKKDDFPLIAHVIINNSFQHFVVVYKVKDDKIIIADPNKGIVKMSLNEWNNISTKKYLIFKPQKKIPKINNNYSVIRMLFSFIYNYRLLFITIAIMSFIYTILSIITTYNFKFFLNDVIVYNKNSYRNILFILLLLGLVKNMSNLFRNKLMNYINNQLDKILFNETYSQIISLPYLYYKTRTCGDVISRINDVTNIKEFIGKVFLTLFVDLILMIFVLGMLFKISIKLTLFGLIISFIYSIIIVVYNKIINHYIRNSYEESSNVNSYLVETISAIDTIKGLNLEESVCNKLSRKYHLLLKINKKIGNILNDEEFFKDTIYYIGQLFIVYFGITLVISNKISITTLFTYIGLFSYYLEPLRSIMDLSLDVETMIVSWQRIKELYNVTGEKFIVSKKCINYNLKGNIKFIGVSYSYNGINNVLEDINITINAGSKVLICGNSGNGKSTLMKLLMKYLPDYDGKIYLDDRELSDYELIDLRKRICYVSQNEMLFSDSVYNNIVLNSDSTYDDVLFISKLFQMDDVIAKMPLRYDTLIEENGFNLSGGERQRIVLARSFLKETDIYILDEALSAIDIKTERLILENMFKYWSKKTIIVVSHRFNNADIFDKKIVLGDNCEYWFYYNGWISWRKKRNVW